MNKREATRLAKRYLAFRAIDAKESPWLGTEGWEGRDGEDFTEQDMDRMAAAFDKLANRLLGGTS